MDRLGELRTLVAIVDGGSLAAAARRLNRSPPSITRDLADLEHRVGVTLVERSARTCRPTRAGARLADQARRLLGDYEDAIGEAAGEAIVPRGLIRVTAPITFGDHHVAPLIGDFIDAQPGIAVDLQLVDRFVDLVDEEYDLAVRIGRLVDGALIARKVGELRHVAVASPAYLAAKGSPDRPEELVDHQVVEHGRKGPSATWRFRDADGRAIGVAVTARLTVNQPEAAVAAARNGRGVVRALSHQVDADLRSGRLVRILQTFEPEPLPVSLVWPASRRSWRRIRLLIDHLAEGLGRLEVIRRSP